MNIRRLFFAALSLALLASAARAQPVISYGTATTFTPGDLLVERMGDGSAALGSAATAIFLDDYSPLGILQQSIELPTMGNNTSGNYAVTDSGSGASDGFLTLSSNGRYIAFTGYSANAGVASITGTSPSTNPRLVGTLSFSGAGNIVSLGSTAYGGNNIRSAYTNGTGTNIWAAGANSTTGEIWSTNAGTPAQLTSGATGGNKTVNAADGQLFASNGVSILAIGTGTPTAGTPTTTALFANISSANITQFFFADLNGSSTPNTLYMANNQSNTTAILKYTLTSGNFVGGTWVATGDASIGSLGGSSAGALGLTGVVDGNGSVTIYGTTAGAIFDLTDSSGFDGMLSGTAASLVTASGNEAFRGIAFTPEIPEPGETAALLGGAALAVALSRRRQKRADPPTPQVVPART